MATPKPTPLGLKKSFGYGDRLGLATPGHLACAEKWDYAPIFAQQSIREMTRTQRTPQEVMAAATAALEAGGWTDNWGADADHLKNEDDVRKTFEAGFCFFTIDPSDYVENRADSMNQEELAKHVAQYTADGVLPEDLPALYEGKVYEVLPSFRLEFSAESLYRAAVKYGRAIAHCEQMAKSIREICGSHRHEIEVSVDETETPTAPIEHLFFGLELKRRNVFVVSLAPRFIGDFEKGIDYKGNLAKFEDNVEKHVAIAKFCGPYKLSIHSGSDKLSIYPILGRVCGELIHVKTAGTSYLEALRVVLHADMKLFREILSYSLSRFDEDKATYHISTKLEDVAQIMDTPDSDLERLCFGVNSGRQLLHVTFGSVLTKGQRENGDSFKSGIMQALEENHQMHADFLERHFDQHLSALNAG